MSDAEATDVLGIGTSPLMLMRAIRLAESGRRVLLADRAATPGGGWMTPSLLGFGRVEVGAHLLENRLSLMRGLEVDMGVPMQADPAFSLIRGRRAPMGLTRAAFHAAVAARALARGETDKARRGLRSAWRTAVSSAHPYKYPREGAWALLEVLGQRLGAAGGVVRHGLEVQEIRVENGLASCVTNAGIVTARLVLMSSRAWAPVMIDGVAEPVDVEQGICWNAVLRVAGAGGPLFSYVEILGDPMLKRVRDIGEFARPNVAPGERLLVVQYRQDQALDDRALGRLLSERLAQVRLLERPGDVLAVARTDAPLSTLTDSTLQRIAHRSRGQVETLETSDLAEGFVSAADRLRPLTRVA